jgi:methyl-accepting chemotaxis protein
MRKAGRRAIVAFLVLPVLFAVLMGLILYLGTHWPYPPGFEWVSRLTPRNLYGIGLTLIVLYAAASVLLARRLARRWMWEPSARVIELMEGVSDRGVVPALGPPHDPSRLLPRLERALERHRSASAGVKEMEEVRRSVGRLCEEIERMGLRHFDRDFSEGGGSLAPLGRYLTECCAELSGFLEDCKSVASQIGETMETARRLTGEVASQAERSFVGHGEVSVGIKDFSKRIEEVSRMFETADEAGGPGEGADAAGRIERVDKAVSASLDTVSRLNELDESREEIFSQSKRLADEATVIALNAAIESSKSGSKELEALAENARRLAEGSMAASEKVGALSARYGEVVSAATEALSGLREDLAGWSEKLRRKAEEKGGGAELDKLLASLRGFAASLEEKSEEIAGLSETASSKARDAGRTTEEALREVEALMRRLGAGESSGGESRTP